MPMQSVITIEYLGQLFQQCLREPIEIFTRNLMVSATLQHEKLVEHHVSVWESLTKVEATLMVISILGWCIMLGFALLALFVARSRYGSAKRSPSVQFAASKAPGVSIIRPLKGVDCNLYENLASSFRQDYPLFEIILSVARDNDPAVKVVRELIKRYPKVDARLIIGERNVGMNPKINNMITSYETAKYDIIWIMDSNVTVDPGCLGRSVEKLSLPGVGLVHHLPYAVRPGTFGSELEMMFLDTVHAKMYLAINFIGPDSCVVGKSNLYRRSDVESVGGLSQFGEYMAEDNLIARALWRKGLKHEMTNDLAYQPLGSMTTADYFLRRSRWTRIRKYTVTAATVVEPFTESILCGLMASYGFNLLWQIHPLNFFAFHIIIWFMFDLSLFQALSGKKIEVENLRGFIMAWALREITALPLYIYSVSGNTVDWRDGAFRLMNNSTVIKIPSPQGTDGRHKRNLSFPSLKLPKGPSSPNFSLNSVVVSTMTSVILVIDIIMDILFKSQRNGNPQGFASDSVALEKKDKESLRRLSEKRRRRVEWDGTGENEEGIDDADSRNNSEDERDYTNKYDPIIRAAGRYLKSSWSKTSSHYFNIPHHHNHESEEDMDNSDSEPSVPSTPPSDDRSVSPTSRRNSISSYSSSSSSTVTSSSATSNQTSHALNTRRPSLLNELFWGVSIGLSMHLQNEKNAIEGKLRRRRSTSISNTSSIVHATPSNGVEERQRVRSMSLEL